MLVEAVAAKEKEMGSGVVGVEDAALQVGHEDRIGGVLDQTFVLASRRRHTRSYGDWSSDVCSSDLRVAQRRGVQRRRDRLPAGGAWVEASVARDPLGDDLAQGGCELASVLRHDETRHTVRDQIVGSNAKELGNGVVGLEDLALQVGY